MDYIIQPLGDHAVIIRIGNEINESIHKKIRTIHTHLEQASIDWIIECVPSFTTVTVYYDLLKTATHLQIPYKFVTEQLHLLLADIKDANATETRLVELPVCYGGEFGPDLEIVAKHNSLTIEKVIDLHSERDYLVYMIGFAPGFPYIGGLNEKIATPRKDSPRLQIPVGSVAIGGKQTGVYPIQSPGGWQIIGRTPVTLFQPRNENPSLLRAGDQIRFKPISLQEYVTWEA
ncbi:5-oxoprolinase subunit PxpB [Metabacillus herbersteinensis]|uniref:5-oxoprolinase subunit PxpB n=1 Tax=Metabacillus herbersteinensis TaxID=283816 RepID=A0ABV6GGC2_9BACI